MYICTVKFLNYNKLKSKRKGVGFKARLSWDSKGELKRCGGRIKEVATLGKKRSVKDTLFLWMKKGN